MALVVLWTEAALLDLRNIVAYIASDNPAAARKMGERLIAAVENLAEHPRSARVVPEYSRETLREVIVAPYRIVVQLDDPAHTLTVIRLWHAAAVNPAFPRPTDLPAFTLPPRPSRMPHRHQRDVVILRARPRKSLHVRQNPLVHFLRTVLT